METVKFVYSQQQKNPNWSLCVDYRFKNQYFHKLKNHIEKYLDLFSNNNVEKVVLTQSDISESCYLLIKFIGFKVPFEIRISEHENPNSNNDDFFIVNINEIESKIHFNSNYMYFLKNIICQEEKNYHQEKN